MISMSIDPSIRSCGFAIWQNSKLMSFGVHKPSKIAGDDWQAGGHHVGTLIKITAKKWKVKKVFCEFPAYFGPNVTASSGALVKLAWFVGFLDALFNTESVPFQLVPVHVWKGQLPKVVVQGRIERILNKDICKKLRALPADAFDAVGIGLFMHGRMK